MRKLLKILSFFILALALIAVGGWFLLKDNIHTVIPGQLYRSAELSKPTLSKLVKERGIKTIINLEGSSDDAWYYGEIAISKRDHIKHYNMSLNAHHIPRIVQLRRLVDLLETAPRPILIHCHRGADRTGLASAIAIILTNNSSLKEAEKQYSIKYLVTSPNSIGKLVIPLYANWLTSHHLQTSRANFLNWLNQLHVGPGYPLSQK